MNRVIIKILGLVFLLSFFVYLACNKKALNIPPPTQSEGSFFTTEGEFRTAMAGAYATLVDYYSSANSGSGGSAMLEVWLLPGDDMTIDNSESFEFFNGLNSSDGKLNQFFKSSYIMIGRANKILDKLNTVAAGVFTTPGLKDNNEGEALFIRAYAHFMLWNVFGTAPVDTIVVKSPSQFNIPSSTGTQLLDQSITDLTRAATLLPASWDNNNKGRATISAANALLGKCLVFRASATKSAADYTAAVAAFDKVTGATLATKFGDNFLPTTENNSESLFEYQGGLNIKGGDQNAWLANDACDCGVAGSYFQMFYDGAGTYMGGGRYLPSTKLKNIFDAADPRLLLTINAGKTAVVKYVVSGDVLDGAVNSINNHRLIRLADVLLLKAEAVLQSNGSTATAIGLINQVRTRARNMVVAGTVPADLNTAEANKTTIMQWIMDERLRELAGEGHRWFDLRRWHLAGYITLDNAFFSSEVPTRMKFDTHFLYFPIPTGETSKNPNIIQNPGY
jgi:starch-binding outer membrane protein, SusD/RagB family